MGNREKVDYEDYSNAELFSHLIDHFIISEEETFEHWTNLRAEMIKLCEEND